ncbi:hypothetical protein ACWIGM_05385 [Bosea sp. NPDC055332]
MSTNAVNKTLEIVESTYEPTPCGRGMQLRCLAQEVAGSNGGRLAYLDFVLEHSDERIQERGQRAFAALRRAVGVLNPTESEELHWKAFRLHSGTLVAA